MFHIIRSASPLAVPPHEKLVYMYVCYELGIDFRIQKTPFSARIDAHLELCSKFHTLTY